MGDLVKFKKEVTDQGDDACLPKNLSDYWLDYLMEAAGNFADESDKNYSQQFTVMTAAVIHILFAKTGTKKMHCTYEELFEYFNDYHIELGMESVSRKTEMKYEPATIETIFSNRTVKIWNEQGNSI